MPKRLTKLRVTEVSAVDRGAGEGVRVVLMKRGAHFTGADELVDKWEVRDQDGKVVGTYSSKKKAKRERDRLNAAGRADTSVEKALAEIDANEWFVKTALTEDKMNYTEIEKAAAQTVVQKFNARVDEIAQRDRVSHATAMTKIAGASSLISPEDASLWNEYRQASEVVKAMTPVAASAAPVPMVSAAFGELQKRAAKLQKGDPKLSSASAFAKAYSDPANRDLVEQDRQFHFNKAAGGLPDPMEELVRTVQMVLGCSIEHARGLALEIRAKKPTGDALYPRPAA